MSPSDLLPRHRSKIVIEGETRIRTHCRRGHELVGDNVGYTWRTALRKVTRYCAVCQRAGRKK